jgi:UPF0716 protein FxsA
VRRPRAVRTAVIALPLVELASIIGMYKFVGFWWTLGLLIAGGVAGGLLIASGGRRALLSLRRTLSAGEVPDRRLANGALTVAGGVLLAIPGFVTDILGLIFVLPPTRRLARGVLGLVATRSAGRVMLDVKAASAASAAPGGMPRVVSSEVIRTHDTPG